MITPPSKYLVVSVRKSDGQTYFPDNPRHRKGIDELEVAIEIADNKARTLSDDYWYVVYDCTPLVAVERDSPPVKRTYL